MRHSDINLTMNRYSHTYLEQEAEAINKETDEAERLMVQEEKEEASQNEIKRAMAGARKE